MKGLRLPAALRWGIVIGLALLALAAIGQFLRRRAWEEPLLDEPPMASPFPEPRLAEPPAARPTFAAPAATIAEPESVTQDTAEIEAVTALEPPAAPEPPPAVEPPAAPTDQVEPVDGACPASHPIKGNIRTRNGHDERIYHTPGSQYYDRTSADACFATVDDARAAGFRAPREG
jgi:hypothetical protein